MPNDLRGIKVEHDVGAFKEGRDLTLVIKDAGIVYLQYTIMSYECGDYRELNKG